LAHTIPRKSLDDSHPTPTLITADAMRAKLHAASIHVNSPLGRGVLITGNVFVDDADEYFIAPQSNPSPSRQNSVAVAGKPASRELTAEELRNPELLGARNPVTGLRPGQDLQDAVAERLLEARGYGGGLR
jgi:hypothetical protein